jgi:hypothetical protein
MMKEKLVVKNLSVVFKLNSDFSQGDHNKLAIIQLMTISVLMMKMETFSIPLLL